MLWIVDARSPLVWRAMCVLDTVAGDAPAVTG